MVGFQVETGRMMILAAWRLATVRMNRDCLLLMIAYPVRLA
jgi:hypothetical protein